MKQKLNIQHSLRMAMLCVALVACQLAGSVEALAQDTPPPPPPPQSPPVLKNVKTVVDQMPEFKGGQAALLKYIKGNLKVKKKWFSEITADKVYATFVVLKNGSIHDVKVIKSSGHKPVDEAVVKMLKKMPKWQPGVDKGKTTNVKVTLPVAFKME